MNATNRSIDCEKITFLKDIVAESIKTQTKGISKESHNHNNY